MRFENYIKEEDFNVLGFFHMFDDVNEASDEFIFKLQKMGQKYGVKVRKTKTFQQLVAGAGKGVLRLMKLVADYAVTADILDPAPRKKLEADIKAQFSGMKKEDVIAFMVNLDKSFLGITAIPRHIVQNILGIEITSYNNWQSNADYLNKNIPKIISILHIMGDTENEKIAKQLFTNVTGKTI